MSNPTLPTFDSGDERPTYEVVDVTPEMAHEFLGYNTHNRPMRHRVIKALAEDMASGNWEEDGQSIKFGRDGALLDGQHRLAAIIKAEVPIRLLVVRNVPNEAQENMDTQARRSFGDVLKLRNEKLYTALAAAVRRVHMWENGSRSGTANWQPTNRQLLQTLEKYPWLRDTVSLTQRVGQQIPIPGSTLALCHWLFVQIDADDCEFFFQRLGDGVGLNDGDPIHVLRRTVLTEERSGRTGKTRINTTVMTAYLIKAWNAYRQGKRIGLLRFKPGGANPETFPLPE
jgi:hypothetical protein